MPEIRINLPEPLYRDLFSKAKSEGYDKIEDYLFHIIYDSVKRSAPESVQKEISRIERNLMDLINKYTSKIDDMSRRIASLQEKIEEIENRVNELSNRYEEIAGAAREKQVSKRTEQIPRKPERAEYEKPEKEAQPHKKTAIEILKEQKIIFESSIAPKIRDRDSFFRKLESEGAKILKFSDERVAVDSDFWRDFLNKLESLREDNEESVKKHLSKEEYKLFEKLKREGMIAYSFIDKKWILIEE